MQIKSEMVTKMEGMIRVNCSFTMKIYVSFQRAS